MNQAPPAEWNARVYHDVSRPHVSWGRAVLDTLPLRGDETALDAGCGSGRLTRELLERLPNGRVIAVDRSANMLAEAASSISRDFPGRVRFVQADLQTIEPGTIGEPVDIVFSTATFHWVSDHPRLFRNLWRLLKPGGLLVAQCGGGPNIASLVERLAKLMASPPFAAHFAAWAGPWNFSNDEETAARLSDAGFTDIATGLIEAPVQLEDRHAYRTYLETVVLGEHLARLPAPGLRDAFLDSLVELAAADDPAFLLDYWRLNLRGRRPA